MSLSNSEMIPEAVSKLFHGVSHGAESFSLDFDAFASLMQQFHFPVSREDFDGACQSLQVTTGDSIDLATFNSLVCFMLRPDADRIAGEDAVLKSISVRVENDQFPCVLPEDVDDALQEQARLALTWVRKDEAVRIQSLVNHKYAAYRSLLPPDADPLMSEAVVKANWVRLAYYTVLQQFLDEQKRDQSSFSHLGDFVPAVVPEMLPPSEQACARSFLLALRLEDLPAFKMVVASEYAKLVDLLSAGHITPEITDAWFRQNYFTLLGKFNASRPMPPPQFVVGIPLDEMSSEHRHEITSLCAKLSAADQVPVERRLSDAWDLAWAVMPQDYLRDCVDSIKKKWLKRDYAAILRNYVAAQHSPSTDEPAAAVEAYQFEPLVALTDLQDSQVQREAEMLISQMQPQYELHLKNLVDEGLSTLISTISVELLEGVEEQVRANWLKQNYFKLVRTTVDVHRSSQSSGQSKLDRGGSSAASLPPVPSPKKRRRVSNVSVGPMESITRSVQGIHCEEVQSTETVTLEAHLLYYEDEPRWVKCTDRKTKVEEQVPVLSCLVADATGPLCVDLWRAHAQMALKMFDGAGQDSLVCIKLANFAAKSDYRRSLTPIRKLHSTDKSELCLIMALSNVTASDALVPISPSLYMADFGLLTGPCPFVTNIVGIVCQVGSTRNSAAGAAMRSFKLCDPAGKYVQCCALGRHAEDDSVENDIEAIFFFASARKGNSSNPGQLWLYDDSHFVVQRRGCLCPPLKTLVELRD